MPIPCKFIMSSCDLKASHEQRQTECCPHFPYCKEFGATYTHNVDVVSYPCKVNVTYIYWMLEVKANPNISKRVTSDNLVGAIYAIYDSNLIIKTSKKVQPLFGFTITKNGW